MITETLNNEPFFKKSMKLVKKLWYLMSRKEILDPELEPIFDKLIKRKDLQMRKQFLRPKEPSNKFSLTLLANYENLRVGRGEVNRALENADIGTFIEKIKEPEHGLEAQLRRLTASENDAKAYARRKGEDFKGYSGMLEAVKENGVGGKLKGIVTRLEQLGIGRERNANIRADGAAISFAERLNNLTQRRRLEAENIIDEDRAIPVGVCEAIGRRIKLGMKRLGLQ